MKRLLIVTDAWHPQINGVVRSLERLAEELVKLDIHVDFLTPLEYRTLPCPTYPEIRLSLTHGWAVRRRIETMRPDYIHIATEGPLGLMARRAALDIRSPGYTTSYHTRFPEYVSARLPIPQRFTYAMLRRFHNTGLTCMVATETLRADLTARGFTNLAIWSRGVDIGQFHPRDDVADVYRDLPRPIALNVGRISVEKNLEAFLDLDMPGSKVVIGDGPQLESLRRRYPQAHFLGPKVGDDLARHYAAADVFVFPSRTDTFGNVIVEALSSGVPVAGYPVMGPIDIVGGTRGGALSTDLGEAVRGALTLNRRDAVEVASAYTWEHSTRQFLDNIEAAQARRRAMQAAA
ncbi:glycosyltransferase family 1 protein [Siculibacillus lacustris]|uniref:Glycosyltransferase family 1 protein n=1 Tax=Siculibacillus lacustris TaxID=1549641 RepID=A0A4Q9VS59_9HYPH|nr:glycosyltransferase family 1 protein [Siculibacillus lacustris]TBW38655.1 glycosyltransferase family 1 protein [Siculibacillus lacustris]